MSCKFCSEEECCDNCVYGTLVTHGVIERGKLFVMCTNAISDSCGKEHERKYVCKDFRSRM